MKLHKIIVLLLVLTIGALATGITAAADGPSLAGYTVETISTEFRRLDPFVTFRGEKQILDVAGARSAGIDDIIVDLAQEMVEYQNRMREVAKVQDLKDMEALDISLAGYPLLAEFDAMLQDYKPSEQIEPLAPSTHPCGTYSHPVPNYTPSRPYIGWYANAHNTLVSWGFHQTAGYACGGDPFVPCERDYTRGRGYSGPYGYCSSPRFRDQGSRDAGNHDIWIQYGEPNPEIHSYLWPYWDWGWYVRWWHNTY